MSVASSVPTVHLSYKYYEHVRFYELNDPFNFSQHVPGLHNGQTNHSVRQNKPALKIQRKTIYPV
jgi:hypothetical protein